MKDFTAAYRNQEVLITGGFGFIGSNLARRLLDLGADVTLLDNMDPDSGANPFNLMDIKDRVRVIEADINDESKLRSTVVGKKYLFNLAGQMSHFGSMQDPFKDLNVNSVGQLRLLEVCRTINPEISIVFAGTRQVYGRPTYLPVDEKHLLTPLDNNGVSKRSGEMYHIVYNRVYDIPTCVLRMTNTYGPRMRIKDDKLTFIGWWFRQLLEGKPIQVFGDGKQIRDFNFVEDAIDAILRCASTSIAHGKIYNLGGSPISLLDLAKLMIEANGGGSYEIVPFPAHRKRIDIGDYYGDYTLINSEVGWQPQITLSDGLKMTIEYYKQCMEHYV